MLRHVSVWDKSLSRFLGAFKVLKCCDGSLNVKRKPAKSYSIMNMRRFLAIWLLASSSGSMILGQDNTNPDSFLEEQVSQYQVGRWRDDVIVTPVNQLLTPMGRQVELAGMRPQALALSQDGTLLLVAGKTNELVVIDPTDGSIRQRVALPDESQLEPTDVASANILKPDRKGQVSYKGLIFSADQKQVFMSNVEGSVKVFAIGQDGRLTPSHTMSLPPANAPRRKAEIPSGLALAKGGQSLLVCGNLSNQLLELDLASGQVIRSIAVGAAPYDVVVVGKRAVVSNWAGRRPEAGDLVGPAGRGTTVRVDPVRHIASEGSVSIVNLESGIVEHELLTGLHASALAVSPDQQYVVCANAGSDSFSIVDLSKNEVIETVWTKTSPAELFGASPNALAFAPDGQRLYVANGTQNAIAVFNFDPKDKGDTKLLGMLPVGWFPGALAFDAHRQQICVANIKGLPITPKKQSGGAQGFNTHHYHGSVSLAPLPKEDAELAMLSERVAKNMRRAAISDAALPPRENVVAKAIPERIGEPSLIKHVVYVIKENRTYDQVFGDLKEGRGNAELCIFGEQITPNQHKMVREFALLDNTYCAGILSADGHQWSTTAFSTDYMEKSFAGFPRSYPDGMGVDEADALAYSPAGFLWDNALLHAKSIRNYGEFMMPKVRYRDPNRKGTPNYLACYRTWKGESDEVIFESEPSIESIRPFSPTGYVGWEMSVPDQFRADFIINELKEFERKDEFPNLVIICLPNDHTSGTSANCPTPASCMADGDLAFGRIVDALSHSKFWKEMAIFSIEDDPQAGWDHVSGYRTTAFVVSPYARRNTTITTQYNTTSVLRTIEQILGMKPMNQFDASALPMFDCFTEQANFAPFDSVPNNIPLDQMNPNPSAMLDSVLRSDAIVSATLNFREVDKAPEDVLNRILWRAMKGSQVPYPEWAVTLVEDDD
jgi:DNA-binding beta-propeller fold protein YncE